MVGRVLDALSAPAGAEDDRSQEQRYHDAVAEAMRRLAAAGLLPERAGQPVKAWAHISLADLILLDADSALQDQWTAHVREQWAARRAQASETGANEGAWLDGDAAEAIACDAAMAPIVTGDINVAALEDLVRLCAELDARRRDGTRDAAWAALEQGQDQGAPQPRTTRPGRVTGPARISRRSCRPALPRGVRSRTPGAGRSVRTAAPGHGRRRSARSGWDRAPGSSRRTRTRSVR